MAAKSEMIVAKIPITLEIPDRTLAGYLESLLPHGYPECLMCITSPSCTMYSLPSRRSVPLAARR